MFLQEFFDLYYQSKIRGYVFPAVCLIFFIAFLINMFQNI